MVHTTNICKGEVSFTLKAEVGFKFKGHLKIVGAYHEFVNLGIFKFQL